MENPEKRREIIQANYARVVEQTAAAARLSGRQPEQVHLVVVTKTQPIDVIEWVVQAGATHLGENYVEEAVPKIEALAGDQSIHWHMVGHVQSRKAENVCAYFQYVHSVDSVKLAERLSRFACEKGKSLVAWLEFNPGGEESKSGWNIAQKDQWELVLPDINKIVSLPGLRVCGLMGMPPYSLDPEASRPYYRLLKDLQRYIIDQLHLSDFAELSMGMSGDFGVAIQEGATWIRVGQAILGPRPKKEG